MGARPGSPCAQHATDEPATRWAMVASAPNERNSPGWTQALSASPCPGVVWTEPHTRPAPPTGRHPGSERAVLPHFKRNLTRSLNGNYIPDRGIAPIGSCAPGPRPGLAEKAGKHERK